MSREDDIKELVPPDPVPIIPCWRHRISTVHVGGVSPGPGPCDAGLHEDCQHPASLLQPICNDLRVDVGEIIPGSDKASEEEGNIFEGNVAQLPRTLGPGIHNTIRRRVKHDLVGVGIQFGTDVINTVNGECCGCEG